MRVKRLLSVLSVWCPHVSPSSFCVKNSSLFGRISAHPAFLASLGHSIGTPDIYLSSPAAVADSRVTIAGRALGVQEGRPRGAALAQLI